MTAANPGPQDEPRKGQTPPNGQKPTGKGSSILARLRAGEKVPGYYIDDENKLRKEGKERPERTVPGVMDEAAMLDAMRHVCVNLASTDHTQLEKWARAWAEKKPDDFMLELRKMEEAAKRKAQVDLGEEEEVEPTETDNELTGQINELLTKHAQRAKR